MKIRKKHIYKPDGHKIAYLTFDDGQSIGNHTYSHNYKYIYSDTNVFIKDVNKCETILKSILGSKFNSRLVRFPGESFGKKLEAFRDVLRHDGYNYIDWNDLTGDAEGQNIPVGKLLNNLREYTKGKEHVVILIHDASTKATTIIVCYWHIVNLFTFRYNIKECILIH